jgi:sugar lactone lactonase YvrE
VAFGPDGKQILSGSSDATIKLWDISSGREIKTFRGHVSAVTSVAFSPDGRQIISGSSDTTAKLWDVSSGREVRTFSGDLSSVNSVAFSPDGKQILYGLNNGKFYLWDMSINYIIDELRRRAVTSVAFSPDGIQQITSSANGVSLWTISHDHAVNRGAFGSIDDPLDATTSVAFSPGGRLIISGSRDATIKFWDESMIRKKPRKIGIFQGHSQRVNSVAFSPDGRQILSGSDDQTIKLWDIVANVSDEDLNLKRPERSPEFKEAVRQSELYWAVTIKNVGRVMLYMREGYDPNKCRGEFWDESTPLGVVAGSFYTTYVRMNDGDEMPDPLPDVAILQLLVDAGADVNRRPYIWHRIWKYKEYRPNRPMGRKIVNRLGRDPETEAEMEEIERDDRLAPLYYVRDSNRVIEAFLKAGADPDMRGHPYPYTIEAKRDRINDEKAAAYFAQGTRPINEAIKKGILWESQVDLLLQYTTLDADSLTAARESGDPAMIEKITKLWNEQNAGRTR